MVKKAKEKRGKSLFNRGGKGKESSAEAEQESAAAEDVAEESQDTAAEEEEPLNPEDQFEEMRHNWQRALADYQNLKRRTLSDIDSAVRRAKAPVLENLLLVLDYLDMALATECTTDEAKNLSIGVKMTRDQLVGVLEKEHVSPIDVSGHFDSALHQAIATVEREDCEAGTIIEIVRSGWMYQEQVLRYAQVKVSARSDDEPSNAEASVPDEADTAPVNDPEAEIGEESEPAGENA